MRSCSANDTIIHQLRHRNTTTHYYLILFCILLLEYCCNQCSSSSLITLTNTINTTNVPATSNQVSKTTTTPTTTTTTTTTAIVERPIIDCEQAYVKCDLRKVCAPALRSYNQDCNDLITNQTNDCSQKCLKAMIALKSSDEGDDLVRCDCQQSQYCQQSKERSLLCKPQVDKAIEPNVRVSCSVASWICLADQMCSTALDYYYRNCQSMFTDKHCSNKCNNSLSILYRQEKAAKLIDCVCDGSEEFSCMKYKTYTRKLCLNNKIDDDLLSPQQRQQQQQNEDDDSVEDNWIPVMNGGATSGYISYIFQQRSSNKLTRSQNNINNRKSRANNNVFYRSLYGGSSSSSSIWSCNHLTSIFICWILLYIISAKHW